MRLPIRSSSLDRQVVADGNSCCCHCKAAIGVLSNEKTRKAAGWVLVAILSPIILLIAAFCSILGGSADHNSSILDLCFYGGTLPADIPAEYRAYIEDMQASFTLLDERIAEINSMTEDGASLDAIRVKAFFYALYFGAESPSSRAHQQFVDCFVTYEERTRPLDSTNSEDESAEEPEEETYTVAIPITDIATIWSNIQTALGETVTEEQTKQRRQYLQLGPLRFCYWNRGLDTRCRSAVYRCGWILFSSGLQLGK